MVSWLSGGLGYDEDDDLHAAKKHSLSSKFEDIKNASFSRTKSHDLYESLVKRSAVDLDAQLARTEKTLKDVQGRTDTDKLRHRIQVIKDLIPLKRREDEIDRERAAKTPGAAATRDARAQEAGSIFDFQDETETLSSRRPQRSFSAQKTAAQKQLAEHRKVQQRNFHGSRGQRMVALTRGELQAPQGRDRKNVLDEVLERSQRGPGNKPSPYPGVGADFGRERLSRQAKDDTEWFPRPGRLGRETNLAQQQAAHILSPGATTRNRRRSSANVKPEMIEILDSDNDEENGSGSGGAKNPEFEQPSFRVSSRPTRSTVNLSITQKIGEISAIYPPESKTRGSPRRGRAGVQKGTGTVVVTSRDLLTLRDNEFLNDSVIEFRIKKLWFEEMKQEDRDRCHVFNSFFFEKLSNRDFEKEIGNSSWEKQKAAHDRVGKWTRGVDIFKKDFVFFPIHANSHWSLVILCHPGKVKSGSINLLDGSFDDSGTQPTFLHLDSMSGGHNTKRTVAKLREYLAMEWLRVNPKEADKYMDTQDTNLLHFNDKEMPHYRLRVPQQDNGSDCGVFLLEYLNRFAINMPKQLTSEDIMAAYRNDSCPSSSALPQDFLRRDWFVSEESMVARPQISLMILKELKKAIPELDDPADRKCIDERNLRIRAIDGVIAEYEDEITSRRVIVSAAENEVSRRRERAAAANEEKRMQRVREQERDRVVIDDAPDKKLTSRNDPRTRPVVIGNRAGIPPDHFYGNLNASTTTTDRGKVKERRENGRNVDLTIDANYSKDGDVPGLGEDSSDSDSAMPRMIPSPRRDVHSDDEAWEKVKSPLTGTPVPHQPKLRSAASGANADEMYAADPFHNRRKREGSDSPQMTRRRKTDPIKEVEEVANTQDSIGLTSSVLSG